MSYGSLDNFKVILARMHSIGIRCQHTLFTLDVYANDFSNLSSFHDKAPNKEEMQNINRKIMQHTVSITALFERLVINLFKLLEIHNELENYLQSMGLERLEHTIKDSWKIIFDNQDLIRKWRNLILAHGSTWNKEEIFAITNVTNDTFGAQENIYLCAGSAVIYTQAFLKNTEQYEEVFTTIQKLHQGIPNFSHKDYLHTRPDIKEIERKIKKQLQNEGFDSDISLELKE